MEYLRFILVLQPRLFKFLFLLLIIYHPNYDMTNYKSCPQLILMLFSLTTTYINYLNYPLNYIITNNLKYPFRIYWKSLL